MALEAPGVCVSVCVFFLFRRGPICGGVGGKSVQVNKHTIDNPPSPPPHLRRQLVLIYISGVPATSAGIPDLGKISVGIAVQTDLECDSILSMDYNIPHTAASLVCPSRLHICPQPPSAEQEVDLP